MGSNMFCDENISALRSNIENRMSDFRLAHTLGVEKMAVRLGELFCPHKIDLLRAAALLHDITKELSVEEHSKIYERHGACPSKEELAAPATLHSVTASMIIPEKYPEFADKELIDAVRYHTTGRENMSLCEKLIYLADYIDMSRTFEDCVKLREFFMSAEPEKMSREEKEAHLTRTLVRSFDMTISGLLADGLPISRDTVQARNSLILSSQK